MNRHMKRVMQKIASKVNKVNRIKFRSLPAIVQNSTIFTIEGNNIVGYYIDRTCTAGEYWRNAIWRKYVAEENISEAKKSAFYKLWNTIMTPISESEWVEPFYAKVNRRHISTDQPEVSDFAPPCLIGAYIYPTQKQTSHMLVYAKKLEAFRNELGKELKRVEADEAKLYTNIVEGITAINPKSMDEIDNLQLKFNCHLKYTDMIAEQVKKAKAHFTAKLKERDEKKAEIEGRIASLQNELASLS